MTIKELATEIYYGQSKKIDLSVDDWIEKLNDLFVSPKKMKEDIEKEILEEFDNKWNKQFSEEKKGGQWIVLSNTEYKDIIRRGLKSIRHQTLKEVIEKTEKKKKHIDYSYQNVPEEVEFEPSYWEYKGFNQAIDAILELLKQ